MEALKAGKLSTNHPAWNQVTTFLERIQNEDGGFCSSSYTLSTNKADNRTHQCSSYATATADGILSLLTLPNTPEHDLQRAVDWLIQNENWEEPSGITPNQPGNWEKVLHLYHISVRAQAYAKVEALGLLPHTTALKWRSDVVELLREEQAPDGSFSNPWGAPNKEDDPLLGTALIIRALNAVLE